MKEKERDLNFEITSSQMLTKLLTGVLMEVRRGTIDQETAKMVTLIADKINKNNINALIYKRLTQHEKQIEFFEDNQIAIEIKND